MHILIRQLQERQFPLLLGLLFRHLPLLADGSLEVLDFGLVQLCCVLHLAGEVLLRGLETGYSLVFLSWLGEEFVDVVFLVEVQLFQFLLVSFQLLFGLYIHKLKFRLFRLQRLQLILISLRLQPQVGHLGLDAGQLIIKLDMALIRQIILIMDHLKRPNPLLQSLLPSLKPGLLGCQSELVHDPHLAEQVLYLVGVAFWLFVALFQGLVEGGELVLVGGLFWLFGLFGLFAGGWGAWLEGSLNYLGSLF